MTIDNLLLVLEQRYPDKLPTTDTTSFDLGRMVGTQDVIKFITSIILKEERNAFKKV